MAVTKKTTATATNKPSTPAAFNASASNVSYITSSIPTAADPNHVERKTEAQLNKELRDMSTAERLAYATKLKAAGYSVGPLTGALTKNLRAAWLDAHADLQTEIQSDQQLDLPTFLAVNAGTGGGGKAGTNVSTSIINDTTGAALVNQVYRTLAGKDATPNEIARQLKDLRAAQKANPTRTVYDAAGNYSTSGGINAEQYLTEKVKDTAPAIENRAKNAAQILTEELGGLR